MKFCQRVNIYYDKKYEDAYSEEFKDLLSNFNSFYKKIKNLNNNY